MTVRPMPRDAKRWENLKHERPRCPRYRDRTVLPADHRRQECGVVRPASNGHDSIITGYPRELRRSFALRGPFGPGVPVYSTLIDTRGLYASSCNPFSGMKVLRSTDMGKSFTETKSAPAFPKEDGRALANIWGLEAGGGKKDLWCGVEPASLFRSHDGGDSWDVVPGISNHDHARKWQPGNGGRCLHQIIRDGNAVHLGISTGGHYLSEDGGETFRASNQGVGAGFAPDPYPEFGQCV